MHSPDSGDGILANSVTSAAPGKQLPGLQHRPALHHHRHSDRADHHQHRQRGYRPPPAQWRLTWSRSPTPGRPPTSGAVVTDPLSGILDDATYNSDAHRDRRIGHLHEPLSLTWTADLAPGAAATITFTVTVNNPDTGDKSLTSTITSAAAGNNCPAGGTDPRCTATVDGPDPGSDHHQDRQRRHHHARLHGRLHHHRD